MQTRKSSETSTKRNSSTHNQIQEEIPPTLSVFENSFWTASWIFAILYSFYHVHLTSKEFIGVLNVDDLDSGWFNYKRDVSDFEWDVFSQLLNLSIPWLITHFVGSQLLKKLESQLLPHFYWLLGCIFTLNTVGWNNFLFLFFQPVVFFALYKCLPKSGPLLTLALYFCALCFLVLPHFHPFDFYRKMNPDERSVKFWYITSVVAAWITSRCLSFCLDLKWKHVKEHQKFYVDLCLLLSYCFYLPTVISGPLINYDKFYYGLKSNYVEWTFSRLSTVSWKIFKLLFIWIILEAMYHLCYSSAINYNGSFLFNLVDTWTLAGLLTTTGHIFHLKYLIFYGIPTVFLETDSIEAPPLPRCTSVIVYYSEMWRYFDNGLYNFLQKYLYRPLVDTTKSSVISSATTFTFIFIWHGISENIFMWSLLNFLGVSIEKVGSNLRKSSYFNSFSKNLLSPQMERRLIGFLSSFLLFMSFVSQMYFLLGTRAAVATFLRITSSPGAMITTVFFLTSAVLSSLALMGNIKKN